MGEYQLDWVSCIITLIFIIIDYVSGVIKGISTKSLDSSIMRKGLWHKVGYILIITLAIVCEWAMNYIDLGFDVPLVVPICVYVCITEIASTLENIAIINPDLGNVPPFSSFVKGGKKWEDTIESKSSPTDTGH